MLHCNDDDDGTNGGALGDNDDVLLGDVGGSATRGALCDDTDDDADDDCSPVSSLAVADDNKLTGEQSSSILIEHLMTFCATTRRCRSDLAHKNENYWLMTCGACSL